MALVLEGGHLSPGMAGQMLLLQVLTLDQIYSHKGVLCPLFCQGQADGTNVSADGIAVNDGLAHDFSPMSFPGASYRTDVG
jgi:hypothetical protein